MIVTGIAKDIGLGIGKVLAREGAFPLIVVPNETDNKVFFYV